jgi:serine/threonine protein kinase
MTFGPHDDRAHEGFQREAGILQDVSHRNIVEWLETNLDEEKNWHLAQPAFGEADRTSSIFSDLVVAKTYIDLIP